MDTEGVFAIAIIAVMLIIIGAITAEYNKSANLVKNNYCEQTHEGTAHTTWVKCDLLSKRK